MNYRLSLNPPVTILVSTTNKAFLRFQRMWMVKLSLLLVFLCGLAASAAVAAEVGLHIVDAVLGGAYALIGAGVAYGLRHRAFQRRYLPELASSALRSGRVVALSDDGLVFEARAYPWTAVRQVRRQGAATLLMFSHVDPLVIVDGDLPSGVTGPEFAAQIADWSKAPLP